MNIMQKLLIVIAMVCAVLLPWHVCEARTVAPQIATVDLSTLLVMHPAMAAYDPAMQAFKVARPRQQFIQDKARMAAEKARKIEEYRSRIKVVESQINAERQRFIRDEAKQKTDFDKKVARLASAAVRLHREVYRNKEAENQRQHTLRMRSLKLQIDQLNRQIENENAEMLSDRYTTPTETRQRFAQILAEVRQYAQLAAASRGITIVLDSGVASYQQSSDENFARLAGELDYSGVFAGQASSQLAQDAPALQGHYTILRDQALIWHKQRASILAPFRSDMANTAVVVGGIDLTSEVFNLILKNYRIAQDVQSILISVMQNVGH